jgi:hypothetical protein
MPWCCEVKPLHIVSKGSIILDEIGPIWKLKTTPCYWEHQPWHGVEDHRGDQLAGKNIAHSALPSNNATSCCWWSHYAPIGVGLCIARAHAYHAFVRDYVDDHKFLNCRIYRIPQPHILLL